jgi:hypothetical protein
MQSASQLKNATTQRRTSASTAVATSSRKLTTGKPAGERPTGREGMSNVTLARSALLKSAETSSSRTPKQKTATEVQLGSSTTAKKTPNAKRSKNPTPPASTSYVEPSPIAQPQSQLIRRVKAIIEVPVKEEEYSDEERLEMAHESSSGSGSEYVPEKRKRTMNNNANRRRKSTTTRSKENMRQDEDDPDPLAQFLSDEQDQLLIGSDVSSSFVHDVNVPISVLQDDEELYNLPVLRRQRTSSKHARSSVGGLSILGGHKKRRVDAE